MHDINIHIPHRPKPRPNNIDRPFEYQFILLNEDDPIGCIKGYSTDVGGKDEVVIYICGMKNTFHIETYISKRDMEDFLNLAMSPIFTETFFGSMIYMAGFRKGRQLFCSLSNEQKDYILSNWTEEMQKSVIDSSKELDKDFTLDIYPDEYEEDNTIANVGATEKDDGNADSENTNVVNGTDSNGNEADDVLDEIQIPAVEEFPPSCSCGPIYDPLVRLYMEDKEYGVLLDIDITGYVDAHHKHHHDKPCVKEFDENPEDDLIQDNIENDGIDHVIQELFK